MAFWAKLALTIWAYGKRCFRISRVDHQGHHLLHSLRAQERIRRPDHPITGHRHRDLRDMGMRLLRSYSSGLDDLRPTLQLALDEGNMLRGATNDLGGLRSCDGRANRRHLQNLVEDAVDPGDQCSIHAGGPHDAVPNGDIKTGYRLPGWRGIRQLRIGRIAAPASARILPSLIWPSAVETVMIAVSASLRRRDVSISAPER